MLTEVIDWPLPRTELPPADGGGHRQGSDGNHALDALATLRQPVPVPGPRSSSATGPVPAPVVEAPLAMAAVPASAAPSVLRLDDEEIVDNVLAAVQAALAEADGPLDQRLRDILEPALARFADALVADVRADFAAALRDVAAEAVVQELGRYRRG